MRYLVVVTLAFLSIWGHSSFGMRYDDNDRESENVIILEKDKKAEEVPNPTSGARCNKYLKILEVARSRLELALSSCNEGEKDRIASSHLHADSPVGSSCLYLQSLKNAAAQAERDYFSCDTSEPGRSKYKQE